IANNVRIGKPNATESEIKEVLNQAQILEMIEKLPKGIHTQMDEMGKRFSGGEQQRIAFARVLIQDTPILLCDEPTTGLEDRKSTRLNSSHVSISYAVFCLKKKIITHNIKVANAQ